MTAFFLSRLFRPLLIVLGFILAATALTAFVAAKFTNAIHAARLEASAERDSYWRGEIALSNAKAERERMNQMTFAAAAEARARDEIQQLNSALFEMEKKNAALPNADRCGLDRERLRLLD